MPISCHHAVNPVMEVACKKGSLVRIALTFTGTFTAADIHTTSKLISLVLLLYTVCVNVQAGYTVPVASLLLADPTKPCMKLLLWREAACWIERMTAGDIVHFTCEPVQTQGNLHASKYLTFLNTCTVGKN